LISDRLGSFFF